jgi:hypothetical protein
VIELELIRLGLTWTDLAFMRADLLVAIARANTDLLEDL